MVSVSAISSSEAFVLASYACVMCEGCMGSDCWCLSACVRVRAFISLSNATCTHMDKVAVMTTLHLLTAVVHCADG